MPNSETNGLPLEEAVQQTSLYPELRLSWGRTGRGYTPLSDLSGDDDSPLAQWLSAIAVQVGEIDDKTAAAYLVSIFTWQFGQVLGALYLSGAHLPQLTSSEIAMRRETAADSVGNYSFRIYSAREGQAFDREAMQRAIMALHTPFVDALHKNSKLARAAIWRLVTDGMAAGFLGSGKRMGLPDLAVAEANAILSAPGTPLHNKHWRFVRVEAAGVEPEWFRLRGGCCRLYRAKDRDFCTTCVLRSPQDQTERLRAFLHRRGKSVS